MKFERSEHMKPRIAFVVKSCWVNHEIGYAMGCNLPVVPLSLRGGLPEGMAAGINAVKGERVEDLLQRLTRRVINQRVKRADTAAVDECLIIWNPFHK